METTLLEKPVLHTKEALVTELAFEDSKAPLVINEVKPEIQNQADQIVNKLMSIESKDLDKKREYSVAIRNLGQPVQEKIATQSELLRTPISTLVQDAEDGGNVANSLLSLQEQVSKINPNKVDFSMGAMRKILAKIPGVGTPLARWFAKYQTFDSVINDIVASLKDGQILLERDNNTLGDDQYRMRKLTFELQDYIALAQLLDQKLTVKIDELDKDVENRQFFEEELLFPLRQRILDLQQQLAVNQQGVLATEVIIRNNRELSISVSRALSVTITALNTAATLQVALQHQKKVLQGVQAVNQTTNELISGTAQQLKTQGVEIQKQAAGATLDIETLKQAFLDVESALADISSFRREALPSMAQSIIEINEMSGKMEGAISKMERGNKMSKDFVLEVGASA